MASKVIFGIGGLIVATIVILVIVQTIGNANLFTDKTHTLTVTNETVDWLNATGVTLAVVNSSNSGYTITTAYNATDDTEFNIANVSTSTGGIVTNATVIVWEGDDSVLLSYTYTNTYTSGEESVTNDLRANYSSGLTEVGNKIPTILLIIVVVILFGFLVLLIRNANLMGVGSKSSL